MTHHNDTGRAPVTVEPPERAHCSTCDLPVCAVGAEDPCAGCCACLDSCVGQPLVEQPTETWERDGYTVALWGDPPVRPYSAERDPVPSVYGTLGDIELFGECRLPLDVAEAYAHRILAAVEYQRAEVQRQADANLLAKAGGNGATHDWDTSAPGPIRCRRCRTRACDGPIKNGAVPVCSPDERCPRQPWHEVVSQLGTGLGLDAPGECLFCGTVYPVTAEVSEPAQ